MNLRRLRHRDAGALLGVIWGLGAGCQTPPIETVQALSNDILAVHDGRSYAYVIVQGAQTVLVDAGADIEGQALLGALDDAGLTPSDVTAILLTHGHWDSWAAAHRFPRAKVYVAEADLDLLWHRRLPRALEARMRARLGPSPPTPSRTERVLAGERLTFGKHVFEAIPVPGHSAGSLAYRLGSTLFVGDALTVRQGQLTVRPRWTSDRYHQAQEAPRRLEGLPVDVIATGHGGFVHDPEAWARRNP